ncbi:carboxymuconolactone decarboxylase family protein [Pedomonas mirosovicensis]|uniref:carboxymuconolactone decarboxylase family protein n=1 Tax=Pedomonas mirosovicensis TaxID=2908641 RepID=UPI0021691EC0|nr:carboxymuconolactone decarboxylase family protein [Pedomonas mirosovicensis]MCH8686547.1 carboxymuconolactone decarboxylase family protein [Pedomonas mirosovicensis]
MSRIQVPAVEAATGATADLFARIKKSLGKVPNAYAAIGALQPAALNVMLEVDAVLTASSLSKKDIETIKLVISTTVDCDYCVAAHSLVGKMAGLSPETLRQLRQGELTGDAQRDALASFVRYLALTSGTIPSEQYAAIKAAGYTDQQLVEISLAISAIIFTNVFNRINDTDVDFPAVD